MKKSKVIALWCVVLLAVMGGAGCKPESASGPNGLVVETSAAEKKWVYGAADHDTKIQGSQNWFFLYTEETGRGGMYDMAGMKKCWLAKLPGGKTTWMAGIYDKTEDWEAAGIHWSQSAEKTDRTLCPATDGDRLASAALAFKAPEDGCYQLHIRFTAGSDTPDDPRCDGVTVSVYGDSRRLYSRATGGDGLLEETLTLSTSLRGEQSIYIVVDPNENGISDVCRDLQVEITQTASVYVNNQTVWAMGRCMVNGNGSRQGVNGWRYLYADESGQKVLDRIALLKECVYVPLSGIDPFTGMPSGRWTPKEDFGADWPLTEGKVCWSADSCQTCALSWTAPADGDYTFRVHLIVSPSSKSEGITVTVAGAAQPLWCGTEKRHRDMTVKGRVTLKKGECWLLLLEPGADSVQDMVEDLSVVIEAVR